MMNVKQKILVWDRFIRFYHWLQLALLVGLWLSMKYDEVDLHMQLGLALLALLLVRFIWGYFGSETALLKSLQLHPKGALDELKQELGGTESIHTGHSYLGSYMVLALWVLLLIQLLSGLFNSDDILSDGPLYAYVDEEYYEWFKALHSSNADYLFALIAIHILAIGYFCLRKRGYLSAMFSGYKNKDIATKPNIKPGLWPILAASLLIALTLVF
ncbi:MULTISPECIES: cytochrome b/b6 domain-containing protein [unclassified Agarivorans]|uniref:cytochrome b/b6 domain-containing protein n=1 Tax=unclassified Agarivorans TaxID=2636026 RepID=UPI003D7D7A5E